MTRGCVLCQRAPAKKSVCCEQRLCTEHEVKHDCPRAAELLAMTPDQVRRWKLDNAPEQALTTQVIAALNALPGVEVWRTKRQPGAHSKDATSGLPDVIGFASPGAIFIAVETKRDHKDGCVCASCEAQRDFGERLTGAGGVYVGTVRTVQQALDGVRMGLARRRGEDRRTA